MNSYKFNHNFFAQAIPICEQYLEPYMGKKVGFLEIGSYEGRSTTWFLDNILTHPRSILTCVDPWVYEWEEDEDTFKNYLYNISFHPDKVIYYRDLSSSVLPTLVPEYYDFIYVDGDHSSRGVFEDAVLAFRLLKRGGVMAFDDYALNDDKYCPDGTYPKEAVDAFLHAYQKHVALLHKDWQVWIRKC